MDENLKERLKREGCREEGNKLICPANILNRPVNNVDIGNIIERDNDRVEIKLRERRED